MKSIERPGGRGLVRRVYGGLVRRVYGGSCLPFTSLWMVYQPMDGLPAFYQTFTSLWLVGWLAGWQILSACRI
ncbi:MAG TPA: hypothetical protein PK874_04080 [Desulfobacteraceae bacterium]|nr:hypothetical protein [Desulfobacteraceae bacterium]HPJ66989.1 hypothetical protein [Desulfobacteraceae bacterium]